MKTLEIPNKSREMKNCQIISKQFKYIHLLFIISRFFVGRFSSCLLRLWLQNQCHEHLISTRKLCDCVGQFRYFTI